MKIGIIQTRGLGDIVIAAPIAMYYINRGCEVYWPIDSEFIASFEDAFPKIKFLPIDKLETGNATAEYFYHVPYSKLINNGCTTIICLYSHLTGFDLGHQRQQNSLSFDAYKYAIAKVPFKEKWNFHPRRNSVREARIFDLLDLNPDDKFTVLQTEGSNFAMNSHDIPVENGIKRVLIKPITDNIFDWLGVLERCEEAFLIDSVYVNLIEQLNLRIKKTIYFRSNSQLTPTLINEWEFI
jgi:hypothetical protein